MNRLTSAKFAIGLVAASLVVAAATAAPTRGQAAVAPSLMFEFFEASEGLGRAQVGTIEVTEDCQPATGTGQPVIDYVASGPAQGPYTGTYTETGTATLAGSNPAVFQPVLTFEAAFTIDSVLPAARVEGVKRLDPTDEQADRGNCFDFPGFEQHFFELTATYTADITMADGTTCTTEGTTTVILSEAVNTNAPQFTGSSFVESFDTGTPPVCIEPETCPPGDDEDEDGLIDDRESLFSTLLGNADSDLDGIEDGNDDANGNGEDDEDEDDDECPDDDSDGDGEDDEDEDDDDEDDD